MVENYSANDIQTLSFAEAVKVRISMYMGSADNQGVLQCIREIITNSIDEATMGYGNKITVELFEGNRVKISDEGRGCPFHKRDDGIDALEAIYTMPHSGAKFNDKVFQNVAGMNGIGAKGVALSSSYFRVQSYRNNEIATMVLIDGKKEGDVDIIPLSPTSELYGKSGTIVEFTPAQEVYNLEPISINFNEVKEMCRIWSYLTKGVTFDLTNYQTSEHIVYLSKNGLLDLISDQDVTPINKVPLYGTIKEDGIEAEIAIQWTQSRYEDWHVFTNGLENCEGGTSLTGFKTAFTNFFKKNISHEVDPEILRKGVHYAISCKIPHPSFSNQTKQKVNNSELRGLCQRLTTKMLEDFASSRRSEFECIVDIMSKEIKAEAAADRARKQVLEATKDIERAQKKKVFASDKLKDAEFLGQDSTLLICEGDSALGAVALGRDEKRFGLLAIRGKILNVLTHDDERIFQNEEIKLILSALNINPMRYDAKKLRYGKVGICVDADSDGSHIALLLTCLFYKICPQLIKEGRFVWLRTPLYIVEQNSKRTYYFNDNEMNEAKKKGLVKGVITRAKGIGQLTPEEVSESMFSKEYQTIDTLIPDEECYELLETLMGDDASKRADFIFDNVDFSQIKE